MNAREERRRIRRLALLTIVRVVEDAIDRHAESWGVHPKTSGELDSNVIERVEDEVYFILRSLKSRARVKKTKGATR